MGWRHPVSNANNEQQEMAYHSETNKALPPFLQKLKMIAETVPVDIADWASDGLSYVVKDSDRFEEVLKQHFKGSLQTFIRQLHFYGFRKLDANSGWSFVHKKFLRDRPELVFEIRRKTRSEAAANSVASQLEVQQLRTQVEILQNTVEGLQAQLNAALSAINNDAVANDLDGGLGCENNKRVRYGNSLIHDVKDENKELCSYLDDPDDPCYEHLSDEFDGSDALCDESISANDSVIIDPLPVDMEEVEDIINAKVSERLYRQLADGVDMEEDELALHPASTKETDNELLMTKNSKINSAVEFLAEASEIDPSTLHKVLGLIKKAFKSEECRSRKQRQGKNNSLHDVHCFTKIENAILKDRPRTLPLPAQEVGAN